MKIRFTLSIILTFVFTACSPSGSTFECQNGICIDININNEVQALQPVEFTILVKTEKDVSGLGITIISEGIKLEITAKPEGSELMFQDLRSMDWILNTKGNEEYIFSGIVIFPKPSISYGLSSYGMIVSAILPSAARVTDSVTIYLDSDGKQVDSNQAKILLETEMPGPTSPPDITVVVDTLYPSITPPPQDMPTPTPTYTDVPYPPPGG